MSDINILKPIAIFEQLFEKKIRLEDRANLDPASFSITVDVLPSCHGSCLVKVGSTEVICGVKVKVLPELANKGHVVCNVELNGLANRTLHPNSSNTKQAQSLSSTLQRLINRVVCPNAASQLNVYSETDSSQPVASYVLKLDVLVLHDDGCLLDACVSAALCVIMSARWPKLVGASYEDKQVCLGTPSQALYKKSTPDEWCSLIVQPEWPTSVSFCLVPLAVSVTRNSGTDQLPLIVQPTRREMALWDTDAGPLQLTVTSSGKILDLSLVNAFLPGLWDGIFSSAASEKNAIEQSNLWNAILDCAKHYAYIVEKSIRQAVARD